MAIAVVNSGLENQALVASASFKLTTATNRAVYFDCCKEKAYNVKPRAGRTEVAPVQSHKNWRKYQHGNRIAKEAEFKRVQRFAEAL